MHHHSPSVVVVALLLLLLLLLLMEDFESLFDLLAKAQVRVCGVCFCVCWRVSCWAADGLRGGWKDDRRARKRACLCLQGEEKKSAAVWLALRPLPLPC